MTRVWSRAYGDVTVTTTLARLKRTLKRRGITQDRIAAEAGVGRTYVNHYLNGRRAPLKIKQAIERLLVGDEQKAS